MKKVRKKEEGYKGGIKDRMEYKEKNENIIVKRIEEELRKVGIGGYRKNLIKKIRRGDLVGIGCIEKGMYEIDLG